MFSKFPRPPTKPRVLSWKGKTCAKNIPVNIISNKLLECISGNTLIYKSLNWVPDSVEAAGYPVEFLNYVEASGLPPHRLLVRVGAIIILLWNLDQPHLYNDIRLAINVSYYSGYYFDSVFSLLEKKHLYRKYIGFHLTLKKTFSMKKATVSSKTQNCQVYK